MDNMDFVRLALTYMIWRYKELFGGDSLLNIMQSRVMVVGTEAAILEVYGGESITRVLFFSPERWRHKDGGVEARVLELFEPPVCHMVRPPQEPRVMTAGTMAFIPFNRAVMAMDACVLVARSMIEPKSGVNNADTHWHTRPVNSEY